jgi:hypothetical protein
MLPQIVIPPHTETNGVARMGEVRAAYTDHSVDLQALDGLKPALLHLSSAAFPWGPYIQALLARWQLSRPVPRIFTPIRRMSPEVISALEVLPAADALRVLQGLRSAKILPPLSAAPGSHAPVDIAQPRTPTSAPAANPVTRKPKPKISGPDW